MSSFSQGLPAKRSEIDTPDGQDTSTKAYSSFVPCTNDLPSDTVSVLTTDEIPSYVIKINGPLDRHANQVMRALYERERVFCQRIVPDYAQYIQRRDDQFVQGAFDSLVLCANCLKLRETTVYVAADILHRVLSTICVDGYIAYVIAATLFIAQKYEPTGNTMLTATYLIQKLFGANSEYTREELFDHEIKILELLDYHIECITPYNYMNRFAVAGNLRVEQLNLANYLVQLSVINPHSYRYPPSSVAAAAVMLARRALRMTIWNRNLFYYTGYHAYELRESEAFLIRCWQSSAIQASQGKPTAVYKKFSCDAFGKVSFLPPLTLESSAN